MADIGGKAAAHGFGEGQLGGHVIEGGGQPPDLIIALHRHPDREIALGEGTGGGSHLPQGVYQAGGDKINDDKADHQHHDGRDEEHLEHIAGQGTVGSPGGGHNGTHQKAVFIHHGGGHGVLGVFPGAGHDHGALIAAGFGEAIQDSLRHRLGDGALGSMGHNEDIALVIGKVDVGLDGGAQHGIHRLQGIAADIAVLVGGVIFHGEAGGLGHIFLQQADFFLPQVVIGQHHKDGADQYHTEQNDGAAHRIVLAHQGFLRSFHSYSLTSNL